VPANTPSNIYPFIASITDVEGTPKYTIVDNAKVINNRITTASPPFDGVISFVPESIGTGILQIVRRVIFLSFL
jgi:hypothetical protein